MPPLEPTWNMDQNSELEDVALNSDSASVNSDESYDFADDNFPELTSVREAKSNSLPMGDGDVNSVVSEESISTSDNYVKAADKLETPSAETKAIADETPTNEEFDSFNADAQLSKTRSQLQDFFKQMLQVFENASSPTDTRTAILINKQLLEISRAIAVLFGDDVSALKDMLHARDKEHVALRGFINNERAVAKNEKSELQKRLRQTITQHDREILIKEAQIQKQMAELAEALAHAHSQKQRADKAESHLDSFVLDGHGEVSKLKLEHEEIIQKTKANYDGIIGHIFKEHEEDMATLGATISDHQQKYEAYCTAVQKTHDAAIVKKDREIADLKDKVKKTQTEELQAEGVTRISGLNTKLFAATSKADASRKTKEAEISFLKSQNHALADQRRAVEAEVGRLQTALSARCVLPSNDHLGETADKTVATILDVHQIASHMNLEKKDQTDSDKELLDSRRNITELTRINSTLSHQLEVYKIGNNSKLKEQLNAAQAKICDYERRIEFIRSKLSETEVELQSEFNYVIPKIETSQAELEAAKVKIAILESKRDELAVDYFALLKDRDGLEALCAVQEKKAEDMRDLVNAFFCRLCEVKDQHYSITETLNNYVQNIILGKQSDIQRHWDMALDEIERVSQEPYDLMARFVEKLNEMSEVEVGENGDELDKTRALLDKVSKIQELELENSVLEAKKDAAVSDVKEFREQLDKARTSFDEALKKIEELEFDNSVLEAKKDAAVSGYEEVLGLNEEIGTIIEECLEEIIEVEQENLLMIQEYESRIMVLETIKDIAISDVKDLRPRLEKANAVSELQVSESIREPLFDNLLDTKKDLAEGNSQI